MKYEILANGMWAEVTRYVFRSWSGERKLNGKKYKGKVFYVGTNREYKGMRLL